MKATVNLRQIVDCDANPLDDKSFRAKCKTTLDAEGALVLPNFLTPQAIVAIQEEGAKYKKLAYYAKDDHNIYLTPTDANHPLDHPRNRLIASSKGCITDDQIPQNSLLRTLYNSEQFKTFLCAILEESALYSYADTLASINMHYASDGQELGWHYDNSSFAITLLVQEPEAGGQFEYVTDVRDADAGDMNFELSGQVLDGHITPQQLEMNPGSLVLFRGKNSMHRVTPAEGSRVRMLVVLAYNTEPDVSLSESARLTFFGRLD